MEVNRANQLNPCHAAFHKSRGLDPSAKKATQSATNAKSVFSKDCDLLVGVVQDPLNPFLHGACKTYLYLSMSQSCLDCMKWILRIFQHSLTGHSELCCQQVEREVGPKVPGGFEINSSVSQLVN